MKNKISIIVGGSGQFGISLARLLLKKKYKVIITTRNIKVAKKKIPIKNRNLKLVRIDILNKSEIFSLLKNIEPKMIFYFAGQSSPILSFKKNKITYLSNTKGCQNFLETLQERKLKTKFVNATSSEIFADTNRKLNIKSKKKPISPYGKAKLLSFNKTKFFREKIKLNTYNAVIFNSESSLRDKNYLIPKICMAAINAKKYNKITSFGNLNISREWNWCDEQIEYLMKFINKHPQDFILSNGYSYSARQMLSYAFGYFNLDYKLFIQSKKKFIRKKDFLAKKSNFSLCLKRNNLRRNSKIYGKKLIYLLIKHYLNEKS